MLESNSYAVVSHSVPLIKLSSSDILPS